MLLVVAVAAVVGRVSCSRKGSSSSGSIGQVAGKVVVIVVAAAGGMGTGGRWG